MRSTIKIAATALIIISSACGKKYTCNCTTIVKKTGEQTTSSWTRREDEYDARKDCGRNEEQFDTTITVKCEFH